MSALAAVLALALAADGGATYTFEKKPLAVGAKYEEQTEFSTKLTFYVVPPPGGAPQHGRRVNRATMRQVIEVLESKDQAITKVRLNVLEGSATETDPRGGAPKVAPSVLVGKTYVISRKKGADDVVHGDGSKVTADELAAALKEVPFLGKQNELYEALPKRPIAIGESLPELAKAVGALIESAGRDSTMATAKLIDVKGSSAVFELNITVMSTKPVVSKMTLSGTLQLRRDGHMESMTLSGPLTMSGEQQGSTMEAIGTVEMSSTRTPSK